MKDHGKRGPFEYFELEEGDIDPEAMTHRLPLGQPAREPLHGQVKICLSEEAAKLLGEPGRLVGHSKTAYCRRFPDHEVIFNACLFDQTGTEIWFGDIDLTLEEEALRKLGRQFGPITLTPEHPYRFEGLPERLDDNQVRVYEGRES
jgi:hypothetical protein